MMQRCFYLCVFCIVWLFAATSFASVPLNAFASKISLDGHFEHFVDAKSELSFTAIAQPDFIKTHFVPLHSSRSLGYNTDAHWFGAVSDPAPDAPKRWASVVGSAELENVDVWLGDDVRGFQHYALGYHRSYEQPPARYAAVLILMDAFAGTQVYLRVTTTNALNVHANLWQVNAFTAHETRDSFYRGGYFGILLIVVVFYFIFGLRTADAVLLAYAG